MKVSFVANFMNHHQLPFSQKMIELTNGNYCFIACTPLPKERIDCGYSEMNELPFVIKMYEKGLEANAAIEHIKNDDYVIFGSCPNELIRLRESTKKPFIFYSERFFKKGTYRRFIPTTYLKIYERMLKYENANCSILCSSAYLPYDLSLLRKKFLTFKWGYFPEFKKVDVDKLISTKKTNSIIWVGRLIKLKHPEYCIFLANKLKRIGVDFHLTIIGDGPLRNKLNKSIIKNGLCEFVTLTGAVESALVRDYMDSSEIFIFNSDKHEGWGAVVNEAMNSACAVVSSKSPGSIPFLIEHGKNGLVYTHGKKNDFVKFVYRLLNDSEYRILLSKNAYYTIENEWNSEIATERLFDLMSKKRITQYNEDYVSGPCSLASIIK